MVSLLTEIQPLPRRLDDEARAAPLRKPARLLVGEGRLRAVAGARRGRVGDASCSKLARRAEGASASRALECHSAAAAVEE